MSQFPNYPFPPKIINIIWLIRFAYFEVYREGDDHAEYELRHEQRMEPNSKKLIIFKSGDNLSVC